MYFTRCKAWLFPSKKNIIKLLFVIGSMIVLKICFEWQHQSASKYADVRKVVEIIALKKNNVNHKFQANGQRKLPLGMAEKCDNIHRTVQNEQSIEQLVRSLRNVIVVDDKKLLFCYVPKIACTNWKRILLILKGILTDNATVDHMTIHQLADRNLQTLSKQKVYDAMKKLQDYKKVMFVREPFSRLLSAYRDKLETSGRVDSDRFRKDWSASMKSVSRVQDQKNDVTFLEYINYLVDPVHPLDQPEDEHWNPIYQLCRPCDVQYDFIGRMENLEGDSEYVLKHVIDSNLKLNLHNSTNFTNSSSADIVRQYYSQIPVQTVIQLYKKYRPDFDLFGYPFPWFAVNISGS